MAIDWMLIEKDNQMIKANKIAFITSSKQQSTHQRENNVRFDRTATSVVLSSIIGRISSFNYRLQMVDDKIEYQRFGPAVSES